MMSRKLLVSALTGLLLVLVAVGSFVYYIYRQNLLRQTAFRDYQQVVASYKALKPGETDFSEVGREFEDLLRRHGDMLTKREDIIAHILWADTLSEIDRKKAAEILKLVSLDESYPNDKRSNAIDFIVNDYELDFTDPEFARREIFSGTVYEDFLREAGGDVELAIRKLNEWAIAVFPNNIIAHYRVAKWYASELYRNSQLPPVQREEFLAKVNEYLTAADRLFGRHGGIIPPQRRGLAYELKARTLYLSGSDKEEVERIFNLSLEEYRSPPRSIFQRVYITRSSLYYAAFLAREYGLTRQKDIQSLLKFYYEYLLTLPEPEDRNARLVSFLIAARDATTDGYPFADFDRRDIELFRKLYPEFGVIIDGLDLRQYVKGHPLESQLFGR